MKKRPHCTCYYLFVFSMGEAAGPPVEDPRQSNLRNMFGRLAGADGEVDAEELQDILTASLTKSEPRMTGTEVKMFIMSFHPLCVCTQIRKFSCRYEQFCLLFGCLQCDDCHD